MCCFDLRENRNLEISVVLDRVIGGSLHLDEASRVGQHFPSSMRKHDQIAITRWFRSGNKRVRQTLVTENATRLGYRGHYLPSDRIDTSPARTRAISASIWHSVPRYVALGSWDLAYIIAAGTNIFVNVTEMSHRIPRCIINFM